MAKKSKAVAMKDYKIRCRKTVEVLVIVKATSEDNAITRFEDGCIESELDVDVVSFERHRWPKLATQ
jgi:hypothetical protein